jgi:hypothetical protein
VLRARSIAERKAVSIFAFCSSLRWWLVRIRASASSRRLAVAAVGAPFRQMMTLVFLPPSSELSSTIFSPPSRHG